MINQDSKPFYIEPVIFQSCPPPKIEKDDESSTACPLCWESLTSDVVAHNLIPIKSDDISKDKKNLKFEVVSKEKASSHSPIQQQEKIQEFWHHIHRKCLIGITDANHSSCPTCRLKFDAWTILPISNKIKRFLFETKNFLIKNKIWINILGTLGCHIISNRLNPDTLFASELSSIMNFSIVYAIFLRSLNSNLTSNLPISHELREDICLVGFKALCDFAFFRIQLHIDTSFEGVDLNEIKMKNNTQLYSALKTNLILTNVAAVAFIAKKVVQVTPSIWNKVVQTNNTIWNYVKESFNFDLELTLQDRPVLNTTNP